MSSAIQAWNFMGGLDFAALETVALLVDRQDLEILIHQLACLRAWQK